jgi:ATP-dependent DNA helicase RecQ
MNPWFELLREAVAEYADEIADAELPREYFVEWLAEWGREARRRRAGLLLSSAHAAKGLEFDHVAVLDGGWSKGARGEDPDAQRRLYYVAMTRAKHTLLLARMSGRHPLLDALGEDTALLHRTPMQIATVPPALARRYLRLSLRDVDLGFAGRLGAADPVHRAIGTLQPGDPLTLRTNGRALELLDNRGSVVGRLARGFEPPRDMQAIHARVAAIVCRRRDDGRPDAGYAERNRCDAWEVVVPELVYASAQEAAAG